eukprot:scaffold9703_cov67-Phaeocystis_antarctica.AAC.2
MVVIVIATDYAGSVRWGAPGLATGGLDRLKSASGMELRKSTTAGRLIAPDAGPITTRAPRATRTPTGTSRKGVPPPLLIQEPAPPAQMSTAMPASSAKAHATAAQLIAVAASAVGCAPSRLAMEA